MQALASRIRRGLGIAIAVLALGLAVPAAALAQTYYAKAPLSPSDAATGDQVGWSVTIDGDRAVIGAPFHDLGVADAGAAYAFRKALNSWTFEHKFVAPSPGASG